MPHSPAHHRRARGFTLIEAAVATLIVAVMVSAAISVVGGAARGAALEREWRRGQALASALMAESLAASFSDPQGGSAFGIDSGELSSDRSTFDDVDDFDGYSDTGAITHKGEKIVWAADWDRRVEVVNVDIADPAKALNDEDDTGLRRITVTVVSPRGESRSMVALKSRDGVIDAYTPRVGESRITGIQIGLRAGDHGSLLIGGASLFNAPVATLAAAPAEPAKVGESTDVIEAK